MSDTMSSLDNWSNVNCYSEGFPGGSVVKSRLPMQAARVQSLGGKNPLEQEMATHSSILALKIPRTEESGWLQSEKSQEWDMT